MDLVAAQTRDPFRILVGTILSSRTQDATTAAAVSKLFSRAKNPAELAALSEPEIEALIYPVGFYHTKAKQLKQLPAALEKNFNGRVPDEIDALCELPGVGRKTANLVRALAFGKPAICVDVHVHRISNRLGLVQTRDPHATEMALRETLPRKYWMDWNSILVAFGQTRCRPVKPRCAGCPIAELCPSRRE
jgi:endonuclease III